MPERNTETGRYTASFPPERFVEALDELGGEATTQEVRGRVECAYRTAHARLSSLESEGRITGRSVGRAKRWRATEADV